MLNSSVQVRPTAIITCAPQRVRKDGSMDAACKSYRTTLHPRRELLRLQPPGARRHQLMSAPRSLPIGTSLIRTIHSTRVLTGPAVRMEMEAIPRPTPARTALTYQPPIIKCPGRHSSRCPTRQLHGLLINGRPSKVR